MDLTGQAAPLFSLPDQSNQMHDLTDYRGQWVLLYFYPKDNTPGCTREACDLRDQYAAFKQAGLAILGVSVDSVKSHASFANKYSLPFPLLSDSDKTVIKAYGVWGEKKFMGKRFMGIKRSSFLIDPLGKVAKVYASVDPKTHAEMILQDYHKLVASSG